MGKRFTDTGKWRNEWYRGLPMKAKIVWIFLCDECDYAGIWKADYGLASYQVDFKFDASDLLCWFGEKVHFFNGDCVLIKQFFEFQYGETKDSWTAKVRARARLEALGFSIINNKIIDPKNHTTPTVVPQSHDCRGVGVGVISINSLSINESKKLPRLAEIWNEHCGDLAKVKATNHDREKKNRDRLKEAEPEDWIDVVKKIAASEFCNGGGAQGWRADFDWLLQPSTRPRVIEGKYDNRKPPEPKKTTARRFYD